MIVSITGISLILCIILSLVTSPSDVSGHLPALSETGIYPPTKYIFTAALLLPSISIIIGSILKFFAMKEKLKSLEHQRHELTACNGCVRMRWLNIASVIFAIIAGFNLLGVGLVPIRSGERAVTLTNSTALSNIIDVPFNILESNQTNNDVKLTTIEPVTGIHLAFNFIFTVSVFTHMVLSTILAVVSVKMFIIIYFF